MKTRRIRHILLFILFIVAILILTVKPLAQGTPSVKFRVVDYDPENNIFVLRPSKHIVVGAEFQPTKQGALPRLWSRVGKSIKCESSNIKIGYWVDVYSVRRDLYSHMLVCEGETLFIRGIYNLTAHEYRIIMRDRLIGERKKGRIGR